MCRHLYVLMQIVFLQGLRGVFEDKVLHACLIMHLSGHNCFNRNLAVIGLFVAKGEYFFAELSISIS